MVAVMSIKQVIKKTLRFVKKVVRKITRITKYFMYPRRLTKLFYHMRLYNKLNTRPEFHASLKNLYPCLHDWDAPAGSLSYYFWQDLWAARKIFLTKPHEHFDIGSRVDGFIAHVLPFMPVTMIDIRPLPEKVHGLNFIQSDATRLENISDNSIISLSSLCAPEHFGLGRYGDFVEPEACFEALRSMQRVLARGGHLYVAVPIGERNGVAFNAHRIFRPELIVKTLDVLKLVDFSVICSAGYVEHVDYRNIHALKIGMDYGGGADGLFEFVKD